MLHATFSYNFPLLAKNIDTIVKAAVPTTPNSITGHLFMSNSSVNISAIIEAKNTAEKLAQTVDNAFRLDLFNDITYFNSTVAPAAVSLVFASSAGFF